MARGAITPSPVPKDFDDQLNLSQLSIKGSEIRYWYREPKPGLNFSIDIGAITFSAETKIVFSTNFDFCQMADWKI